LVQVAPNSSPACVSITGGVGSDGCGVGDAVGGGEGDGVTDDVGVAEGVGVGSPWQAEHRSRMKKKIKPMLHMAKLVCRFISIAPYVLILLTSKYRLDDKTLLAGLTAGGHKNTTKTGVDTARSSNCKPPFFSLSRTATRYPVVSCLGALGIGVG